MKVFIFMRYLNNFGAPKMLMWVAERLAQQGYSVTMYTYSYNRDVTIPQSFRYVHENLDGCSFFSKVRHIKRQIIEADADVSISFLLDANVYNIFACLGLKTKSVVCERNDPFKPHYYKLKFWKPWFRLADGAIYQLPKVAEYYDNIKGLTTVIPNPVTVKSDVVLKPFKERDKKIVTLGRLDVFQKRQDVLIKAFAKFHEIHSDYSLVLYGQGPDENKLKLLISELGLQQFVTLAGNTLTPHESIKDAKMFVLSSDFEGIPNAIIEAMVLGLPCIATDCRPGGAALLIKNKKNGLLCPKGDVDTLADCMSWMVEHPMEADNMGHEAQRISESFSEEKISMLWSNYIKLLCGDK